MGAGLNVQRDAKKLTTELLGRHTTMRMWQAADDMPIEANHDYVSAPNRYVGIPQGILHVTPPGKRQPVRMPIDFFRTLLVRQLE